MLLLGCRPPGRFTEQHDIYFGIGKQLSALKAGIIEFWPEAKGQIHIDAWRQVELVDNYKISVEEIPQIERKLKLYFINLGGYQSNVFAEPHHMMLTVAQDKAAAIKNAKESTFYKQVGFEGAPSHVDDKYSVDVDDIHELEDILHPSFKSKFHLHIHPVNTFTADSIHLGYLPLFKLL